MKQSIRKNLEKYEKERKEKRRRSKVVTCLACVVVFCTVYALMQPAITMATDCPIPEHTHSEDCFTQVTAVEKTVPICDEEALKLHRHTEGCYDEDGNLLCGDADFVVHRHDSACYDEDGTLWCPLPELEAHTHSAECFTTHELTEETASEETVSMETVSEDIALEDTASEDAASEDTALEETVSEDTASENTALENAASEDTASEDTASEDTALENTALEDTVSEETALEETVSEEADSEETVSEETDAVQEADSAPSCGKEEIVLHEHTQECYDEEGALICGKIRILEHQHSDTCFATVMEPMDTDTLTCTLPEDESHTHGPLCYGTWELTCSLEEHTHDAACTQETEEEAEEETEEEAVRSGGAVRTADPTLPSCLEILDIQVGEEKTANITQGGYRVYFRFTPPYTHGYVFESTASADTYGHLYDASGKQLTSNDDSGTGSNFKITYSLTADTTYYFAARYHSSATTGEIPVKLSCGDTHSYDAEGNCACGASIPFDQWLQCGDNAFFSLSRDGTLTIRGNGATYSYSSASTPWYLYRSFISSVVVEEGITGLGNYLFYGCTEVSSLSLPDSLTSIGNYAFRSTALTSVVLPESVTSLGTGVFYNCTKLTTAVFPSELSAIPSYMFYSCSALTEITIPDTVTTIGDSAFNSCKALTSVVLPDSVTSLGTKVFAYCTKLTTAELPSGLSAIPSNMFYSCSALTEITIPDTVTTIGDSAFNSCKALTSVVLPDSVTSIGSHAFRSCENLRSVKLSENLTAIPMYAFGWCYSLNALTVPDSVTEIGDYAFNYCTVLSRIALPDTLTSIGLRAFYNTLLTEVHLPRALTTLKDSAFLNSNGIHTVILDSQALTPASRAFSGVTNADTLVIGKNVDTVTTTFLSELSAYSTNIRELSFEGENYFTLESALPSAWKLHAPLNQLDAGDYYVDASGVVYLLKEDNTASLFYVPEGLTAYDVLAEIPSDGENGPWTVTTVQPNALYSSSLQSITFADPNGITALPAGALGNCLSLTAVNGCTTVNAAGASFPNAAVDAFAFYGSGLSGDSPEITVDNDNDFTLCDSDGAVYARIVIPADTDGDYTYYTGETVRATLTVSNPENGSAAWDFVRFYFAFVDDVASLDTQLGELSLSLGDGDTYNYRAFASELPGIYCVEVPREIGKTFSLNIGMLYPNLTSAGGTFRVWAIPLTEAEEADLGYGVQFADTCKEVTWVSVPDTFPVTKAKYGTPSLGGDGTASGTTYVQNLAYTIAMKRSGDTLEGKGKDLMQSADYTDTLTLPEGMHLNADIIDAIRSENYFVYYTSSYLYLRVALEDGSYVDICTFKGIVSSTTLKITNIAVEVADNDTLVLRWTVVNTVAGSTEMSNPKIELTYGDRVILADTPLSDAAYTIQNQVSVCEHFAFSEDQTQNANVNVSLTAGNANFKISKTVSSSSWWGGSPSYTITLTNNSARAFTGISRIVDDKLSQYLLIKPEQMQTMISQIAAGSSRGVAKLIFTIDNAVFCSTEGGDYAPGTPVLGTDGKTYLLTQANTGVGTEHEGTETVDDAELNLGTEASNRDGQITIVYDKETNTVTLEYKYTAKDGAEISGTIENVQDLSAALEETGYVVTLSAKYSVVWQIEEDFTLYSNESIIMNLPCTVKDTFELLTEDTHNAANMSSIQIGYNYVDAYYEQNGEESSKSGNSLGMTCKREWRLDKGAYIGGAALTEDTSIACGDVIDYSLSAYHEVSRSYSIMPLVDHMSGAQILMVPVESNQALSGEGLTQYTDAEGRPYYLLMPRDGETESVYRGIRLGGMLTDSITVTKTSSGEMDYLIRWYLTEFSRNLSTVNCGYKALVAPDLLHLSGATFSISNESWLNDHESHRLYAALFGSGVVMEFSKDIVTVRGESPVFDQLTNYSPLHEGESVTYRITLKHRGEDEESESVLTGADIYDALPKVGGGFVWSPENVKIEYVSTPADGEFISGDLWSISDTPPAYTGLGTTENQQYIRWENDFSVTVKGTVYIYVTLTLPSGDAWQSYAQERGCERLENRFYLLDQMDIVYHDLVLEAQPYLQKGVYGTGLTVDSEKYSLNTAEEDSRYHYGNKEDYQSFYQFANGFVLYDVFLYNGGEARLYLNDLQDMLPKGFTYYPYVTSQNCPKAVYDANGTEILNITWIVPQVSAVASSLGSDCVKVTFTLKLEQDRYDSLFGKYYLLPGEAVYFSFGCYTNEYAKTEDIATNVITMPYFDHLGNGATVPELHGEGANLGETLKNDGSCRLMDTPQANLLGFTGGSEGTEWLTSDVTVTRGEILPGITKSVKSTTTINGSTIEAPTAAGQNDTITWSVYATNSGSTFLCDYSLTDVMQSPYIFTGEVRLATALGVDNYDSNINIAYVSPVVEAKLFDIARTGNAVTLSYEDPYSATKTMPLTVDGDPVSFKVNTFGTLTVSMYHDGVNEALSIRFHDMAAAIPNGGSATLFVSTKNVSGTFYNKDFYNTCYITPEQQSFSGGNVSQGNFTLLNDQDSVRNSSQIFVSYGYATSSVKKVEEVGNESNAAVSNDLSKNYILLDDSSKQFRYTLTVQNAENIDMDQLILIDSLPQIDDHSVFTEDEPRYSEFWVRLAEDPRFTVTVGNQTLTSDAYTLQYSAKTEFTPEDWSGTSNEGWTAEPNASTRSFRLILGDNTEIVVPQSAAVNISFNGRIVLAEDSADDSITADPLPGETAWNSFGYRYSAYDSNIALEAAPLKVGIRIHGTPTLQKQLIDAEGETYHADRDLTFRFLIYQGAALNGVASAQSEERIARLLSENSRAYTFAELTVKEGECLSEELLLNNCVEYTYADGSWNGTATPWSWSSGEKYTIFELPFDGEFILRSLGGVRQNNYTFTFTADRNQHFQAVNVRDEWTLQISKTDAATGNALSGAWFAIYSPNVNDQIAFTEQEGLTAVPQDALEYEGKTYYLMKVEQTPEDGTIVCTPLVEKGYLVVELQAPDGYYLDSTVHNIEKGDAAPGETVMVTLTNVCGYELPESGGIGTSLFATCGLLLITVSGGLLLLQCIKRRRRNSAAS